MPRKPKPPAVPVEMPRTEADLDRIMKAVEDHQSEGHRLGTLYKDQKISASEVLDQAALADARLYQICDEISEERHEEFSARDKEINQDGGDE